MAVSISNIPKNTNIYRFITSGKPGNCIFCRKFVEKLEAHHTCYDPERTIKLCHNCHHKTHFWINRLTDDELLKLLKTRFHHQTALSILKESRNNIEKLASLIAPSRSRFVRKAQKFEIKRLRDLPKKRGDFHHNKLFKEKKLNISKITSKKVS